MNYNNDDNFYNITFNINCNCCIKSSFNINFDNNYDDNFDITKGKATNKCGIHNKKDCCISKKNFDNGIHLYYRTM